MAKDLRESALVVVVPQGVGVVLAADVDQHVHVLPHLGVPTACGCAAVAGGTCDRTRMHATRAMPEVRLGWRRGVAVLNWAPASSHVQADRARQLCMAVSNAQRSVISETVPPWRKEDSWAPMRPLVYS